MSVPVQDSAAATPVTVSSDSAPSSAAAGSSPGSAEVAEEHKAHDVAVAIRNGIKLGASLLATTAAAGVLCNVARNARRETR